MEAVQLNEKEALQTEIPLHKNVRFTLYWIALICSGFSLSMYMIGESWYVVSALDKKEALGLVLMATTLPRLLLMLIGGVMADRFRRSLIMVLSNLVRGLVVLSMVGLLFIDALGVGALLLISLLFGLADAFYWPANQSLLPSLVSKEQLTRANSIIQTTQQFSVILGPMLAGWMIVYGSYEGLFTCCAVLLLAGGITLFFIREPFSQEEQDGSSPLKELKEGLRYVRNSSFLFTALLMSAVINFFYTGPLVMGIPIVAKELLQGSAVHLSLLESSFAGGMVLGSLALWVLNPRKKRGWFILTLICLSGALIGFLSQVSLLWQGIFLLVLIGACNTGFNIPFVSLVQEIVDQSKIGRVMSLIAFSSLGLMPLSYSFLSTLLSLGVSISIIFSISGFVILLLSLYLMLGPKTLRSLN